MEKLLETIKPKKEEMKKVNQIVSQIKFKLRIPEVKLELGGSGAKNTNLSGDHDIDIFIKFSLNKYKDKDISKILENYLSVFKYIKLHGSRDYFHVKFNEYTVELVPIYEIKKATQALNITDISPLHTKFVKKHKHLVDQIRLTKAFVKAQGCYGAESYIRGFSGYTLEILTIHYKSFKGFIKNCSKWTAKVVIDTNKLLKNPLLELNSSKTESPLVLVDPVDPRRNTAAALSLEMFHKLINSCKKYIKNPSEIFFIKKQEKIPLGSHILEIIPFEGKPDIVGTKLVKLFEYFKKQISDEGYTISKSGWKWDDNAYLWFKIKDKKLSKYLIKQGPFLKDQKNCIAFKKQNSLVYPKNNRLYAKVLRKYASFKPFLENLILGNYIKDKAETVSIL